MSRFTLKKFKMNIQPCDAKGGQNIFYFDHPWTHGSICWHAVLEKIKKILNDWKDTCEFERRPRQTKSFSANKTIPPIFFSSCAVSNFIWFQDLRGVELSWVAILKMGTIDLSDWRQAELAKRLCSWQIITVAILHFAWVMSEHPNINHKCVGFRRFLRRLLHMWVHRVGCNHFLKNSLFVCCLLPFSSFLFVSVSCLSSPFLFFLFPWSFVVLSFLRSFLRPIFLIETSVLET